MGGTMYHRGSDQMEFIELASFTEEVQAIGAEESLRKLQVELLANPEKGDLIQGTGGFRKVRMNLPGRGKSGSARIIYLYLKTRNCILWPIFTGKRIVIHCHTNRKGGSKLWP
jgi:hypothetical protein